MMTRSCQLWGTLLLSITMLSFAVGSEDCHTNKCKLENENRGDHCKQLGNCSSGNYCCHMTCKGEGCKQTCYAGVDVCKMDLECNSQGCEQTCHAKNCTLKCRGNNCRKQKCGSAVNVCEMDLECDNQDQDCEQICNAKECKLNCSGKTCKTQKCEGQGNVCEMDLKCNNQNQDCEQTCNAKNCTLKCCRKNCKTQKCQGKEKVCKMDLECNSQDCEQICNAKECKLNCSGNNCKTQKCEGQGNVCEMDLKCNNQDQDCEQTCNAKNCTLKCCGKNCKTQKCEGQGNICEMDLKCNNQDQDCEQTCDAKKCIPTCGAGKSCNSTKCSDSHCITSDSYTSSIVTSIGASTIQVFATKIPTGHGTEASTLLQSLSQSPLPSILPSPLPSSPSHSPSAAVLSTGAKIYLSTLSPSSSNPAVTSASGSSSAASSKAISTAGAPASSSAPSPSSSKPIETLASSSGSPAPVSSSAGSAAVASSLLSSLSDTSAAGSSSSPSLRTPQSSRLEVKNLANDSVSKLKGEEISRTRSLMEAIRIFEDFITSIKILQNSLTKEEIEITRNSIFKVADALEVFALNYGKHQMIGANSSVEINSDKLLLAIQKTYRKNASDFYLRNQELQASLKVSSKSFNHNVSVVVGIVHKDLHEVLITDQPFKTVMGTTRYLDSWKTAVALDPKPEKLLENVIFRFKNLNIHEEEKKCMFWSGLSESSGGFSETGCHLVTSKSNSEGTVCSCNHLTHFAVLLDYNGSPGLTEEDETILEIITYVGLSLSIFAILLTIILYSYLTDVWQPLTQIRLSLSFSLGAGQITFLAGINATENTALCVLAAAFLQYFLMAAFCWMLVEGIYFFLFVVKVYNINTKMHMYHFISWGIFISLVVNYCNLLSRNRLKIGRMTSRVALTSFYLCLGLPIVMVSISVSITAGKDGIKSYTSEKYCWLSSTNNLIWIFVTFVAFIEVLNILILVRVIKEMSTLMQHTGEKNHTQQIRLGIKTCAVMIPLLGVTWLFGLLLSLHKAFAYIFTILNSTQGILIFVLHCVRNSQIRERLRRKINIVFPSAVDHGNSGKKSSQVNPKMPEKCGQ